MPSSLHTITVSWHSGYWKRELAISWLRTELAIHVRLTATQQPLVSGTCSSSVVTMAQQSISSSSKSLITRFYRTYFVTLVLFSFFHSDFISHTPLITLALSPSNLSLLCLHCRFNICLFHISIKLYSLLVPNRLPSQSHPRNALKYI